MQKQVVPGTGLRASESSTLVIMAFVVCLWIIWNGWAAFFLWLTTWSTISNSAALYDFSNLYSEGKWWLAGAYLSPGTHAYTYPFAYPPSSLPFFGFFAQFAFGNAAQLWTAMGLTVFSLAVFSLAATLRPTRKYLFISLAALFFFTSYALRAELQLGQINLLLEGLTILSLTAQRWKHSRISATLLAAATLLKGPPVLFLLYFVFFYRDLRYLLHFLESTVGILAISFLVVPIQLYSVWMANIFPTLFMSASLPINESITAPLSLSGFSYLTPGIFAAGICIFAALAYRVHPNSIKKLGTPSLAADAVFLMNSLVILLLGTRSWPQDYVWVILPVALFLSALLVEGVKTPYFIVVGLAAFLFNFDTSPLFVYYINYYSAMMYMTSPHLETIPTGLLGGMLMVPCLILLLIRPGVILQHSLSRHSLPPRVTRKTKTRYL